MLAVDSSIAVLLIFPLYFTADFSWLATPMGLGIALYLGLVTSALTHIIFAYGLQIVSVHNAATLTLAEPLTAALLGILVVGEQLNPAAFTGHGAYLQRTADPDAVFPAPLIPNTGIVC